MQLGVRQSDTFQTSSIRLPMKIFASRSEQSQIRQKKGGVRATRKALPSLLRGVFPSLDFSLSRLALPSTGHLRTQLCCAFSSRGTCAARCIVSCATEESTWGGVQGLSVHLLSVKYVAYTATWIGSRRCSEKYTSCNILLRRKTRQQYTTRWQSETGEKLLR